MKNGVPDRRAGSRRLREQVTASTTRALREMVGSILVAAEADVALGGGGIFVASVTGRAGPVLGFSMQAGKPLDLVTSRAGRHTCRSLRAVRTMAGHAAGGDASVGALLLFAVAVSADLLRR